MASTPLRLSPAEARAYLLSHLRLAAPAYPSGFAGVRALLRDLRCIQLDPLDPLGTNADLVALARVEGIRRGDVYDAILPGHGFEHYAKERCLLPASAFPWYRDRAVHTPWWKQTERMKRLSEELLQRVLAELDARGPATPAELTDHGAVDRLDWNGWKGTGSATTMALEVLFTRCEVVVCGRTGNGKRYDVPRRALPEVWAEGASGSDDAFGRWGVTERVEAAGLLPRVGGPWWSMLDAVRRDGLPDRLVEEGRLVEVEVEGATRRYLAPADVLQRPRLEVDDRLRILGPLDPLLWDRKLVAHIFGFEYVWEVYKPKEQRRWGWYVCPLLHEGALVGRLMGRVRDGELVIDQIWEERAGSVSTSALDVALERHAQALGASGFRRPSAFVPA